MSAFGISVTGFNPHLVHLEISVAQSFFLKLSYVHWMVLSMDGLAECENTKRLRNATERSKSSGIED